MMRSLWSAVSGLNTHQMEMDVIGNNISNVNTTSYKAQATGFQDILYQTIKAGGAASQFRGSTNITQVGLGTKMGSITTNITKQGSAMITDNVFDLMITGQSFFMIGNVANGRTTQTSATTRSYEVDRVSNGYSRDGGFELDAWGYLVTKNTGYYVLGARNDDAIGKNAADQKPIQVMNVVEELDPITGEWKKVIRDIVEGTPTGEAYLKGNIDKDDTNLNEGKNILLEIYGADGGTYTLKFKLTDAEDSDDSTYEISIESIMDSEGNSVNNLYKNESLILTYDKHDGTLLGLSPKPYYFKRDFTETYDDNNNVTATSFSLAGSIGNIRDAVTITGTDGISHSVGFAMESSDGEGDYLFYLYYPYTDADGNATTAYSDPIELDYDEVTGALLTIDGQPVSEYTFEFAEELNMGELTIDFSDSTKTIADEQGYTFKFGGEAAGKLGQSLYVDFANTTNYASAMSGHSSTIYAYKGNVDGLNKGYPSGELTGFSFGTDGSIYGKYSNGQSIKKGQIAVAEFANAMGLEKIGDNLYAESLNSGNAMCQDVTANAGYISSGALEGSNVDLSKEFTDMITTQRGFQANSRVITTSDEMLQTLKSLKR